MSSFLDSLAVARLSLTESVGLGADPDDNGVDRLSFNADSNKAHARPLHAWNPGCCRSEEQDCPPRSPSGSDC